MPVDGATDGTGLDWELLVAVAAVVVTAATGLGAWFQWYRDRKRKLAAAIVNPFMLACEELQSRFYNLVAMTGFEVLRKRYPEDNRHAEETLYLVAQYFAWARCFYRYGPYADDARVIELTEAVRFAFADSSRDVGVMCFYRLEQQNLAHMVLQTREGEAGLDFDVISFAAFRERLADPGYFDSPAIQQTLSALRAAEQPSDLSEPVLERMETIQEKLVALLEHLDRAEKLSFFAHGTHDRRRLARATRRSTP